jgi:hypothetical protein
MAAHFPPAVVDNILKYLYTNPVHPKLGYGDLQLDVLALQSYCLVSRVWRQQTQRLLFHQVNLTAMRRFVRIRPYMKTATHITSYVRILSLGVGNSYQTHIQGTELPDILSMFPYLYELRLHIENAAALPLRTIQQFTGGPGTPFIPPISALRITLGSTQQSPDIVLQLLQLPWPLEYLSISQPHSITPWVTAKELTDLNPPSFKLREYRTDGFLNWEVVLEWAALYSLETLTVLHMPPSPENSILALLSPRLRSLNLVYDPYTQTAFEGMADFPPLPELQELTLTNAVLLTGQTYYQSIPMSVCHFGTTLRIKMAKMIEICPTIPMRMETVTVLYEGKMTPGWERMVEHYTSFDGRLAVKRGVADVRTIYYSCQNS